MRVKFKTFLSFSSTTAEESDLASFSPSGWEISDAMNEGGARKLRVAAAATVVLDLSAMAACNFIWLRTDRQITLTLDGEEVIVTVPDGFDHGYFCVSTNIASASVTNDAASTATVDVAMGGDAA